MSNEANSVRPSGLVMARRESSTLFSLSDFERRKKTGGARATPRRLGPSTKAPASEGSGLIDIHAMRAMMRDQAGADGAAEPSASSSPMPAFSGIGLGGLAADPLLDVTPTPAPVQAKRSSSSKPLLVVIALLSAGLLGLGAMVALDEPDPPVVERELIVTPTIDEAEAEQESSEAAEASAEAEEAGSLAKAEAPKTEANAEASASKPRARRSDRPRDRKPTKTTTTSKTSAPAPAAEIDVDCLINNKLPKCSKSGTSKATKPAPTTKPTSDSDLPAKLDQSGILAGIRPVKSAAKACGSGTTVAVKFSVDGASGKVISARALDEHASSTVGKCVAASAKNASFAKFGASQQGFTFKFRL